MIRHSHLTVTYKDLLTLAQQVLAEKQTQLAGARATGGHYLNALTHRVETARTLVRMLRRGLPGKQTDFVELFEQIKHA